MSYRLAATLLFALCAGPSWADDGKPPWQQDDVLAAAWDINLSDDQAAAFRDALHRYVEGYSKSIARVLRRGDVDLERRLVHARRKHDTRFADDMAGVLDAQQMQRFEAYLARLVEAWTRSQLDSTQPERGLPQSHSG